MEAIINACSRGQQHAFLSCLAMSVYNELTLKELSCIKMCKSTVRGKSRLKMFVVGGESESAFNTLHQ